ncbi:hypothetical protein EKD04_002360 [Chloroflexales bacterium ZM16-3]|nr:hypothetical protein [Chloroflexales bacterium ZM16-3]
MTTSHSAGGQAIGYYYQVVYALYHLFQGSDELQIAIERADDIETIDKKGLLQLVQTKHHQNTDARISNSSIDLWKTLSIWSSYLESGMFLPENTLLLLVTTASASPNSIPFLLSQDQRDTNKVLDKIITYTNSTKSDDIKRYASVFLQLKEKHQKMLIQSIKILDRSCNITDIGSDIAAKFHGTHKEHREPVYQALLGWWFERLTSHLFDRSVNFISKDEVVDRLAIINDNYKKGQLPSPSESEVEFPQIADLSRDQRKFIRQLQAIGVGDRRILNAMYDHDRAVTDRTHWARTKLMFENDFNRFDDSLTREWVECFEGTIEKYILEHRKMIEAIDDDECKLLGQEIYNRAYSMTVSIIGKSPLPHIPRGSLHMLANASPSRIGWHPRFQELFDSTSVEAKDVKP